MSDKCTKIANFILRYRWLIALLLFLFCILFRLHGSSIGVYNSYFPTMSEGVSADFELIGRSRSTRSDEWAVQTMTFFSQSYNDYSMMSNRMSIGDQNMILDYFAPVWDITSIAKPLNWGYLLFGSEVGLSWYWCGQLILLFLISFELFLILTQRNIRLSLLGSILITLSPVIQWWFLPHIPIVFLYAMALFDLGYYFFTGKKSWQRILTTVAAGPVLAGFALSLFPSLQLMSGLVMGSLLILCLLRDRDQISFRRNDWSRIAIVAIVGGGLVGQFVLRYSSDLLAQMSTVYPGQRISTGGGYGISDLFTDLSSVFLAYIDGNVNYSEKATFIHLAPLFLVLYPRMDYVLRRKKDQEVLIGRGFVIILLIEIIFLCIGFPEWLAKVTLFRYVNRMKIAYGWTAVLFTVWGISILWKHTEILRPWQGVLAAILYGVIHFAFLDQELLDYAPLPYYAVEIVVLAGIVLCITCGWKRAGVYALSAFVIAAGAFVNPICSGISAVTGHPISEKIAEISEEDLDAVWIGLGTSFVVNNFAMANGAHIINGTNFLPDFEKWQLLDPDGLYEDVWNRYANLEASLAFGETAIETSADDRVHISLNAQDLLDLSAEYILVPQKLDEVSGNYGIELTELFNQDGYYIYRIARITPS